jgi:hypothetical protein
MQESSAYVTPEHRARAMAADILRACRTSSTQAAIAAAIGASESTVSTMLSKDLDRWCLLLAHAGKKVVSVDMRCYPDEYVRALHVMAKMQIQTSSPDSLDWEDSQQ